MMISYGWFMRDMSGISMEYLCGRMKGYDIRTLHNVLPTCPLPHHCACPWRQKNTRTVAASALPPGAVGSFSSPPERRHSKIHCMAACISRSGTCSACHRSMGPHLKLWRRIFEYAAWRCGVPPRRFDFHLSVHGICMRYL